MMPWTHVGWGADTDSYEVWLDDIPGRESQDVASGSSEDGIDPVAEGRRIAEETDKQYSLPVVFVPFPE